MDEKTFFFRNDLRSFHWTVKHRLLPVVGLFVCLFCFFIFISIKATLSKNLQRNVNPHNEQTARNDTCFDPECINAASSILRKMNPNVKPCDNFYEFACGGFLNSTIVPDDKGFINSFTSIRDGLEEQLRTSIEDKIAPNEAEPFKLVKKLYKSCMNKDIIEARGLEPLQTGLKQLGGWPVTDGHSWNEKGFDWKKVTHRLRTLGYPTDHLINIKVIVDAKNNTKRVLALDQPRLGLPRGYLIKGLYDKTVMDYYDYMVDVATILGAPKDRAVIEMGESLLFEIKLANITVPVQNRRDPNELYNPMKLIELTGSYPGVPWKELFDDALLSSRIDVDDNETVIVLVPRFIADFEKLIAETPKRIQANYIAWRITAASTAFMNDEIRARQIMFSRALSGRTKVPARWKECIGIVSGSLATSVGALYVKQYFNEESKSNAIDMVSNIRRQFDEILKRVQWLDEKTRRSARDKLSKMTNYIGYPDELMRSNNALEEFFKNLRFSEDKYFENILQLRIFNVERAFGKLRETANKRDWIVHGRSAIVNAFYSPNENSIQIPAGVLQGDFFNNDRPKYLNYGGIGFIIGHEITHGFDDLGRQFDEDGNLYDWWERDTKDRYLERAACIIDQYGNYTVDEVGLNVQGKSTQGENIADNGGMKIAYLAYENWVRKNMPEKKLPGLSFTPQQMFWISAAGTWCSKYKLEDLKLRITDDSHSPAEFRILGAISNIAEFAKDFHCPIGSKMNPEKKCSVW